MSGVIEIEGIDGWFCGECRAHLFIEFEAIDSPPCLMRQGGCKIEDCWLCKRCFAEMLKDEILEDEGHIEFEFEVVDE